jgi:endogenous inhibitor of DNA gyrase (YacG/DUF329 family)
MESGDVHAPYVPCRSCDQPIELEAVLPTPVEELSGPFSVRCPQCGAQNDYTAADIVGQAPAA